jgi:hypothetical protein
LFLGQGLPISGGSGGGLRVGFSLGGGGPLGFGFGPGGSLGLRGGIGPLALAFRFSVGLLGGIHSDAALLFSLYSLFALFSRIGFGGFGFADGKKDPRPGSTGNEGDKGSFGAGIFRGHAPIIDAWPNAAKLARSRAAVNWTRRTRKGYI